ncbi:Uma2 family endonuclease, partial [Candidatus Gracilibacteria bacterium]|nr:Uma2 family endonuclease [Candidatus Gracilibacteria bacterium]
MSTIEMTPDQRKIQYPDSDGKPMADNTKQFRWIVTIQGNLDALYRHDPSVFVAGDLLWYPVQGDNKTRQAPDAMVVFGRPKGDRGSYMQWREADIAPQVVFEVLSPGNTFGEMARKLRFYERFGVEEYYIFDPDRPSLHGYIFNGSELEEIDDMDGWISPRMRVLFRFDGVDLTLFKPNNERFASFVEIVAAQEQAQQEAARERERAEQAQQEAAQERERA